MSQKPDKDQRKRQHKRRSKRTLTHAVTHIRLIEANPGKLEALDRLVMVYLALCQHYVTHFCTEADPNSYAVPVFATELSQRWQRVAIQQAAGIARAFRTNRQNAYDAYLEDLTDYAEAQAKATASGVPLDPQVKALLLKRHEAWKKNNGLSVVQPPAQLGLWDDPEASTGLG